jgi:hypothetical protein
LDVGVAAVVVAAVVEVVVAAVVEVAVKEQMMVF